MPNLQMQPTHRVSLVGARLIWHRYTDSVRRQFSYLGLAALDPGSRHPSEWSYEQSRADHHRGRWHRAGHSPPGGFNPAARGLSPRAVLGALEARGRDRGGGQYLGAPASYDL